MARAFRFAPPTLFYLATLVTVTSVVSAQDAPQILRGPSTADCEKSFYRTGQRAANMLGQGLVQPRTAAPLVQIRPLAIIATRQSCSSGFESVGDDVEFDRDVLWGTVEGLERVKQNACVPSMPNSPFAYASRSGKMHFPFDYALELARKFCASEPATVLVGVETTEREWARQAATPGDEYGGADRRLDP